MKKYNIFKNFTFDEIYLFLFPVAILFRSASLNLYIILGSILFIIKIFKKKVTLNNIDLWIVIFLIFYFYIIFISFFALDAKSSLISSISQIRFLLFALFITSININLKNLQKIFYLYSIILILVSLDVIYQYIFNVDVFGLSGEPLIPTRLSGPFGTELVVGAYLTFIALIILPYFFDKINQINKKLKFFSIFFISLIYITVLLSGERMAFIALNFGIFLFIVNFFKLRENIIIFSLMTLMLILSYSLNSNVKIRYNDFKHNLLNFQDSGHGRLFASSYHIWKENIIFGVGLKNYRKVCNVDKIDSITNKKTLCSTHPHNIYLELLSETGIIGFILFLTSFYFYLIKIGKNYIKLNKSLKKYLLGSIIIILVYLWPIKSSGSIFSTFNASFFWFNIGLSGLFLKNNFKKFNIK